MIKKAINNVRRMTSHPTLPYCKLIIISDYSKELKFKSKDSQHLFYFFCRECLLANNIFISKLDKNRKKIFLN